jgi:hypothetical protein
MFLHREERRALDEKHVTLFIQISYIIQAGSLGQKMDKASNDFF